MWLIITINISNKFLFNEKLKYLNFFLKSYIKINYSNLNTIYFSTWQLLLIIKHAIKQIIKTISSAIIFTKLIRISKFNFKNIV